MKLLESINSPQDLKRLSVKELELLCGEIRKFLVDNVSRTGGHLASNLGVVELTVAMLYVFDLPKDKIVYDVGHQSYVHKLLTGRRDQFSSLRSFGGISGFPKRTESEYDSFDTGHSSTSISAALGMARAAKLSGEQKNIVALFGDGALTGGMMYEAINDAGHAKLPLILVLNDNAMSISKNVGGVARHLRKLRMHPAYRRSKDAVEVVLNHIPLVGKPILRLLRLVKDTVRGYIVPSNLFDALGLKYFGPIDGHNMAELISAFERIKSEKTTAILHVQTTKGKGYAPAEQNPSKFHGIGQFDRESGETPPSKESYSSIFGDELVRLAEKNDKIVAITGAMPSGTGLETFAKKFKNRFFDVGIAEQHGVTLSAGLAAAGYIPVIPLYSTFLQRAYDQTLHDVCLQNLHVVFPIDRAGIVGSDGETHQGVYDISYLSHMPNMTILSPDNFSEFRQMLEYAVEVHRCPIAIRYPRGSFEADYPHKPFCFGKAVTVTEGSGVSIVCSGRMVGRALEVNHLLKSYGIRCEIIALPTILPLDEKAVIASAKKCGRVITIEDNVRTGGIGSAVSSLLLENGVNAQFKIFAFPTEPIIHGSVGELDKKYGIDAESIASEVYKWLK